MIESLKVRFGIIIVSILFSALTFAPNIIQVGESWIFSKEKIKYGLDIQGGLHLVMGVDVQGVMRETTSRLAASLKEFFERENSPVQNVSLEEAGKKYQLSLDLGATPSEKAKSLLEDSFPDLNVTGETATQMKLQYNDAYLRDLNSRTIEQAIETIRNRIDEFGVSEPSITAQGNDRILVQLPGVKDATEAKSLINKTARLEFQMLSDENPVELATWIEEAEKAGDYNIKKLGYSDYVDRLNQDLKAKLPENTVVYFEKSQDAGDISLGRIPYLLKTDTNLGGDTLRDSRVSIDEFGNPAVTMTFNPTGTKRFSELTGANIGKQMAIVLDKVVYSAPNIESRIPNGNARITMGGGRDISTVMKEAQNISIALRAGALPASLEQLEERTVGPSLGKDSIESGKMAIYVGGALVLLFMLVYYKSLGVLANIGLVLNVFFILALLTALGATLTLPGVAGIALTIGIAVDANVIIFERIKEELKKGQNLKMAVKDGFGNAFSAILDANITTGIVCLILMYFGSGPVRGFAVTLLCGLVTSMFTAIFVSKSILDYLIVRRGVTKLPI